jgi:hypothetical protein
MVLSFAALRLVGRIRASSIKYRERRPHGKMSLGSAGKEITSWQAFLLYA